MKITIGCSRPYDFNIGSELIMFHINTNYSHVYLRYFDSEFEKDLIYQASHGMVHFVSGENFTKKNIIIKEFILEISDKQFTDLIKNAIDLSGQPYSYSELIQIFVSDLSNGKIKFEDQPGYVCSELVGDLLLDLGFKFNKEIYLLTPKDVIESVEDYLR